MEEQCYALLISKIHQTNIDRVVKIRDYYIQKNIWRLDQHAAFELEG